MKRFLASLTILAVFGFWVVAHADDKKVKGATKEVKEETKTDRIFEMRIYYAAPGKMADLNKRFRDHTTKLFEKHGMTLIGFWNPTDPKEAEVKLIYILAYPNKESADKSWKAFREDPEWKKAREASEVNGKLVDKVDSIWMNPTDYSKIK